MPVLMSVLMHGTSVPRVVKSTRESRSSRPPKRGGVVVPLSIKLHKTQLASDRTSCRSALANQVRLVLHTAAYWLMLTVRDAIPKARELAAAEFATLRLRLLKIAARVVETTSRIRLAFAAACPEADLICGLPGALLPLGP
ncbi:hypothetical protein ABIF93_006894 [Bradyrhizobium japonicum]